TDYTCTLRNNTNAGEATVDVSFTGNYSGTATGKFTIDKATIRINNCTPESKVYDGNCDATIKELSFFNTPMPDQPMIKDIDYSVGSPIYLDADVGKDKAIKGQASLIANDKTNNYSLQDSTYRSNKGEITKANYAPPPTIDISIQTGEVRSGTVTMADLFGKAAPADAAFGAVTAPTGAKLMDSVTSASSGIAYTSKNNPAGTSASDIYKVKISSKNYNDFDATITFKTENRQTVAITGLTAATGLTYNGKPQNGCTGTVQVEGNKVPVKELVYTYTGTGSTAYSSTTAPTNAGDYKLVVSVNESNKSYTGAHSVINFTIAKKALSISTKTYKGYQYEDLPVLNNTEALVYDGFADGDGMDGINNTLKASYTVDYATGVNSNTVGDKIIKVIVLGTETNTNYNITLTDGKLIVYKAGTKENPPAALPTTTLSTPVVVTEQNDPSKKLRVITANLYDDEATLVSTWLRSQSGISSSDLLYAQEIDLQVSSDGINWAKATAGDVKNGKLMAVMPLPEDTSPTTHSFLFFHFKDGASKAAEKLEPKYDAKSNTLSVQVSSLSPFAIVATKKGSASTGGGSGSSANDTDEYAFWTSAKAQVEGFSGTVINLNAGNNDKMPESFMEALRKNNKVNLVISWKGDKTITIPAGKTPKREATRIYYPLSQLAELYKDIKFIEAPAKPANNEKAKQNLNPETGGTAYIKYADGKREPVSGGSITIVAPKKEKPTYALPTVGEKAITPPSEGFEAGAYAGTPDARRASGKHWYMATIAAMLAAAAVGSSVWFWKNKRKEDNE
ncbi:MAG: YDG domain-containing protein, partial [Hydrogenoanaerobacterium sp.]